MKSLEFKTYTIAIPTINRTSLLKNLLNDLYNQIKKFDLIDHIEIIVSDNPYMFREVIIQKVKNR